MHAAITTYHCGAVVVEVVAGESHSDAWARVTHRATPARPMPAPAPCARHELSRRRRRHRSAHRRLDQRSVHRVAA